MNILNKTIETFTNEKLIIFLLFFNALIIYCTDQILNTEFAYERLSGVILAISLFAIIVKIILDNDDYGPKSNYKFVLYSFIFIFFLVFKQLLHGKHGMEVYPNIIVSSLIWLEGILNFEIIDWYDGRGLGIPFPPISTQFFNPLFIFYYLFGIKYFYLALWIIFTFVGTLYFIKLNKLLGANDKLSIIAGFLFCFSGPVITCLTMQDWTHSLISWTLLPCVLYFPIKKVIKESKIPINETILYSFFLVLYFHIGNPSLHVFLALLLIITLAFFTFFKLKNVDLKSLIIIAILVFLICMPRMYFIIIEMMHFIIQAVDDFDSNQNFLLKSQIYRLFDNFVPLAIGQNRSFHSIFNIENFTIFEIIKSLVMNIFYISYKNYFLGFVFCFLALSSFVLFKEKNANKKLILIFFFILFIFSIILLNFTSFYAKHLVDNNYWGWSFTFFGIILGSYALSNLKVSKKIIYLLLLLQISQQIVYASSGVFIRPTTYQSKAYSSNFFESKENNNFYNWISDNISKYGENILISPDIFYELDITEKSMFKKHNFYSAADINYNTGAKILNDFHLKGISSDLISPSESFKEGKILVSYDVINYKKTLDILGINLILIKENELNNIDNKNYKLVDSLIINKNIYERNNFENTNFIKKQILKLKETVKFKKEKWVLLHNGQSWNEAFALDSNILNNSEININTNMNMYKSYSKLIKCSKPYLLCQDLENLNKNKLDFDISEIGKNGHYKYSFKSNSEIFVIGLSKAFRKEWHAYSGKTKLDTFALNKAMLGVVIPPNVTEFRLDYRNNKLFLLRLISLSVCSILIILFIKKRKKSFI